MELRQSIMGTLELSTGCPQNWNIREFCEKNPRSGKIREFDFFRNIREISGIIFSTHTENAIVLYYSLSYMRWINVWIELAQSIFKEKTLPFRTHFVTPQPIGLEGYCRHGSGGRLCVDRMLHPLCHFQHSPHPWPWPWICKAKFWKCCISGMGGQIDTESKGCELIGSYTHFVTFNFDLNHDHDHGFWRSNFGKVVFQEWDGWLTWNERDVSRQNVKTHVVTSNFYLTHDLDLGFSR